MPRVSCPCRAPEILPFSPHLEVSAYLSIVLSRGKTTVENPQLEMCLWSCKWIWALESLYLPASPMARGLQKTRRWCWSLGSSTRSWRNQTASGWQHTSAWLCIRPCWRRCSHPGEPTWTCEGTRAKFTGRRTAHHALWEVQVSCPAGSLWNSRLVTRKREFSHEHAQ